MRARESRVPGQGALEEADAVLEVVARDVRALEEGTRLDVIRQRLDVRRRGATDAAALLGRERHLERLAEGGRRLVLQREQVGERAVVSAAPGDEVRLRPEQAEGDPHRLPRGLHGPVHHQVGSQLAGDGGDVLPSFPIREGRAARDHRDARDPGQGGDEDVGDAGAAVALASGNTATTAEPGGPALDGGRRALSRMLYE